VILAATSVPADEGTRYGADMPPGGPRLLLLSMYPLDQGLWGPTVRITHLRDELAARLDLDIIAGYRAERRTRLARYVLEGRLRRLDAIYVESSTFLPAETDLAFLALARSLRIPVLTFIRDAYQLFPEYYGALTPRKRIGAWAFRPLMRGYRLLSSVLAYPSRGLARVVQGSDDGAVILPPGSPPPVELARAPTANRLLFVGNGTLEAQGAGRLIDAVGIARERGADVALTIVSRPGEAPPEPHPRWLRVVQAEGAGIQALLPDVLATVIPRPRSPYNDLAVPVKLFDYLSYARPVLVTDCTEHAAVVSGADAGLVTSDDPSMLAAGIEALVRADPEQIDTWSRHAAAAATRNSWRVRADTILETLNLNA
jgi:glycosyltransferase involved in cell wall biosynthesis